MKPLTLYPHEIRRLIDTGSVTVWRPIPQLHDPQGRDFRLHDGRIVATLADDEINGDRTIYGAQIIVIKGVAYCEIRVGKGPKGEGNPLKPPHPPGSERWVRETWGYTTCSAGVSCIAYRADDTLFHGLSSEAPDNGQLDGLHAPCQHDPWPEMYAGIPWRSPVTMPRWASRLSVVSKAVQARQVQSITEKEAVEAGLADLIAFDEWWQWRFDTLGPDPWAWATKMERKEG